VGKRIKRERLPVRFWHALFPPTARTDSPARDLAAEAQEYADIQSQMVKQGIAYLPLIGLFVIALNILVQARGNVGLAIAVAQNLSFGALTVTVLLNLIYVFSLGLIVGLIPVVFDRGYNPRIRSGAVTAFILTVVVTLYTAPLLIWLLIVVTAVLLHYGTWRLARAGARSQTGTTWEGLLRGGAPEDIVLRRTWANGRSMLRAIGEELPMTLAEKALEPAPSPELMESLRERWNGRLQEIAGPSRKSITTLFYSGMVGFIALYGFMIITQPIKFAPLEQISINQADGEVGYLLMPSDRGIFISKDASNFQYVSSDDQVERRMCQVSKEPWTANLFQTLAKKNPDEVDCSADGR
jgi:hypothetical protein